jgi:hypothetical protein
MKPAAKPGTLTYEEAENNFMAYMPEFSTLDVGTFAYAIKHVRDWNFSLLFSV